MGFFLGIIMLFWIWERGPYRQKMGIMCGVSCQLLLRYLKRETDEAAAHDVGGGPEPHQDGAASSGDSSSSGGSGSSSSDATAAGAALEAAASSGSSDGSDLGDFFSITG
jgi:hypothetical protein